MAKHINKQDAMGVSRNNKDQNLPCKTSGIGIDRVLIVFNRLK